VTNKPLSLLISFYDCCFLLFEVKSYEKRSLSAFYDFGVSSKGISGISSSSNAINHRFV